MIRLFIRYIHKIWKLVTQKSENFYKKAAEQICALLLFRQARNPVCRYCFGWTIEMLHQLPEQCLKVLHAGILRVTGRAGIRISGFRKELQILFL